LLSANEVISIVVGEVFLTGRKATRSIKTPAISAARILSAAQISHGNGVSPKTSNPYPATITSSPYAKFTRRRMP
jgi:hypothetical protein